MTVEEVKELMRSSKTAEEWDANCDKVQAACGGYPDFWFAEIVLSGLADETVAKFGRDARIRIAPIELEGQ